MSLNSIILGEDMTEPLSEIQRLFTDEVRYIDDAAQIVLKGHLVVEDIFNRAIESFVLHGEHVEKARLQFHQKLELCRAISLSNNNNMWNVITKINVLRNALSHSLDQERRSKAVQSLQTIYDQEFPPESRKIEGMSEEAALCMVAIGGVLGYLHSFLSEVHRFEALVKRLDQSMNSGSLSEGA